MTPHARIVPHGYCHCGCGQQTRVADKTYKCFNIKKGEPWRYIAGHQKKIRPIPEDAVPFKLYGVYCRLIPLSQGQFMIVDAANYDEMARIKWYARWDDDNKSYYAVSHKQGRGKKRNLIWAHRFVLRMDDGDPRKADHIDPLRTTENCIGNLRIANKFESSQNRRRAKNNKSGRKGVSWHEKTQKWKSSLGANGVRYYLGEYDDFEVACRVRAEAEIKYHGEFARSE